MHVILGDRMGVLKRAISVAHKIEVRPWSEGGGFVSRSQEQHIGYGTHGSNANIVLMVPNSLESVHDR